MLLDSPTRRVHAVAYLGNPPREPRDVDRGRLLTLIVEAHRHLQLLAQAADL